MSPDESLLERLKAGEHTAYEWLVAQFEGPLFRFFICEHRDYHMAQEQTAETFAQIVRSLPKMKGGGDQLRPFVFSIARHVKLRQYRRPKLPSTPLENASEIHDPGPTPEIVMANREQVERIMNAMSQFEPHVREILLLRFVEGSPLEEVASIVGIPVGTVKSHIHRGLARLKSALAETGA